MTSNENGLFLKNLPPGKRNIVAMLLVIAGILIMYLSKLPAAQQWEVGVLALPIGRVFSMIGFSVLIYSLFRKMGWFGVSKASNA